MSKQIVCFGGGELGGHRPWNDLYVLAQSPKPNPKVCYLGTASADNRGGIEHFMRSFSRYPCRPTYLELFSPSIRDIESFVMEQDIFVVGGGSSKTMLGIWREWRVDQYLRAAYENGSILSGGSAGAVCWFEQCLTDSFPGALSPMPALGLLPGSFSPHFSSQSRRGAFQKLLATGKLSPGVAADDGAGIHYIDSVIHRAISLYPHAKAHRLALVDGRPTREIIPTSWLEMPEVQNDFLWSSPVFADKNSSS